MASQPVFELEIRSASGEVSTRPVDQGSMTLGAGPTTDITLSGDQVAVNHAMVEKRGDGVYLVDLNSPFGTLVNGERVDAKRKIEPGDVIRIGEFDVTLRVKRANGAAVGSLSVEDALFAPAREAEVRRAPSRLESMVASVLAEPADDEPPAVVEAVTAPAEVVEAVFVDAQQSEALAPADMDALFAPAAEPAAPAAEVEDSAPAESESAEPAVAPEASSDAGDTVGSVWTAMEDVHQALEQQLRERERSHGDMELRPRQSETITGAPMLEVREILYGDFLYQVEHFTKPGSVTLGESHRSDFFCPLELIPREGYPLVEFRGGEAVARFTDKLNGSFHDGNNEYAFDELRAGGRLQHTGEDYLLPFTPGQSVLIKTGDVELFVRFTGREKPIARMSPLRDANYPYLALWLLLLIGYGLFVYTMITHPQPEVVDTIVADERFVKIMVDMEEEPEPEPETEQQTLLAEGGPKEVGDEGKAGAEESLIDKAAGTERKALDEKVAVSSGILGALDQGMENQDKLFGGGAIGAGLEENLGNLEGIAGLDQRGVGGLGARGAGMGGGGSALGIGGMGTHGRGGRGGRGDGRYGIGEGGIKAGTKTLANVKAANAEVQGSLDRSIIERIIKKHQSQIRYCYQRELSKSPNLYGRISIRFIIGGNGRVTQSAVKASTMKNFAVEDCVANTIKRIIFPAPKGGGIVVVTFPFVFTPVNK